MTLPLTDNLVLLRCCDQQLRNITGDHRSPIAALRAAHPAIVYGLWRMAKEAALIVAASRPPVLGRK